MSNPKTIILEGNGITNELIASVAITPGMFCERVAAGKVKPHATADGALQKLVAVEDDHQGNTITDDYAIDDIVILEVPVPGEVIYAIAGAAIADGAIVQSNGDGKVKALDAGTPIGVAKEAAAADGDRIRISII